MDTERERGQPWFTQLGDAKNPEEWGWILKGGNLWRKRIYISFAVQKGKKKEGIVLRFERIIFLRTLNTDGSSPCALQDQRIFLRISIRFDVLGWKEEKSEEVIRYDKSFRFQPMGVHRSHGGPTILENRLICKKKIKEKRKKETRLIYLAEIHVRDSKRRNEKLKSLVETRRQDRDVARATTSVSCSCVQWTRRSWIPSFRIASLRTFSLFDNELRTSFSTRYGKKKSWKIRFSNNGN